MTPDDLAAARADCERARAVAHDFWCTPVEETVGVLLRLAAHCERAMAGVERQADNAAGTLRKLGERDDSGDPVYVLCCLALALQAERDRLRANPDLAAEPEAVAGCELAALRAERDRLRELLRPFAVVWEENKGAFVGPGSVPMTYQVFIPAEACRAAADALGREGE